MLGVRRFVATDNISGCCTAVLRKEEAEDLHLVILTVMLGGDLDVAL